jgi:hypothetical protein
MMRFKATKRAVRRAAVVLSVLAATILSSSAAVLFQSIPDLSVNTGDNACSTCSFDNVQVFDLFSLSGAATINAVEFNVIRSFFYKGLGTRYQFPSYVDLSVWTSVPAVLSNGQLGTLPGAEIFSETLMFGSISNTAYNISEVMVDPTALTLGAGTYEISFYNPNDLLLAWYKGGSGLSFQLGTSANYPSGDSVGFALYGVSAVPEPSTWAMMLLGFAGLGYPRYRRARTGVASRAA